MRHNAKIQSRRSRRGGGSSASTGRLRLTLFLATAAAFLLVPAAPALANPTMKVNIIGGGGEVTSKTGNPPIKCVLPEGLPEGSPPEGVCETEMDEVEPGVYAIDLEGFAGPNSDFIEWEVVSGFPVFGTCTTESTCLVASGGENAEVNAYFACEGLLEPSCGVIVDPFFRVDIVEGEGTVASNPAGLICSGAAPKTCEAEFAENSIVTLTASPAPGYAFKSWKGCDPLTPETGVNGRHCTVKVSEAKTVGVKFTKVWELTASKAGGLGKVGTSPGGIVCLPNCSSSTAAYKEGTSVTVTQAPSKHFTFTGWGGDCTGAGPCTVSMSEDHEVEALFSEDPKFALSLSKAGGGTGQVKSKAAGLLCGYTCSAVSADFYKGEEVAVSWKLGKGTTSIEWSAGSGTCTGKSVALEGSCTVTMSSAKSLVAKFE